MSIANNQFIAFKNQLEKEIRVSGMTFDPSIDCRNDLINHYGYSREQVTKMSDDELFSIMDRIEAAEKGYSDFDESYSEDEYIEFDEYDMFHELINDIDNACYNKYFEKANRIAKETYEKIMNSNLEKQPLFESLTNKLNYLTKRYSITFNLA
jgi:hypothetical protein